MHTTATRSQWLQAGFTLVELMVGLAIGMLATVVIIQVMSVFDAQRRATTGSADAQTNGGIALHTIAREMQMAGYPLFPATNSALECTTLRLGAGTTGITTISPVSITDGAVSDTITIRLGGSAMGGIPSPITAKGGSDVTIGSNVGCRVGDMAMIVDGATCTLTRVTGPTDIATPPVASAPPKLTTVTLADATDANANTNLACLGAWNEITYAVNAATGNLERTNSVNGAAGTAVPSVVGVVNLQAQYGLSATGGSNQITQWVNATGAWAAPSVNERKRIKAIRIAVVSRNDNMAASDVTASCSSITAATPSGLCAWAGTSTSPAPSINLTADANWKRYRYRVFDSVVPLRNVIWSKDTL